MVSRQLLLAGAIVLAGCPGAEQPPTCIENIDPSCAPLYTPTFPNVYTMTIRGACGATNNACHSAAGASQAGGLSFADEQTAYDQLLRGRVKAGDAACSEFIVRTHSPGKDYEMPPDVELSGPTKCSLVQWVQNGAAR